MKAGLATYWRNMASGSSSSLAADLVKILLMPLSLPYAMVQTLRGYLYRAGMLKTRRLPRPVISIGNITVGGTGKTPVTASIAKLLLEKGLKVAVLSRGYGGSLEGKTAIVSDGAKIRLSAVECGDEPYLLASTVPGLMVIIGSDRHSAGLLAVEQLRPDIFLLDDGFQHLRLARDLNILLLDAQRPFGNGFCLPAGLLREPASVCNRADLIIHTRTVETVTNIAGLEHIPQLGASHLLAEAIPLTGGAPLPLTHLAGCRVVAFAGIAEPENFFQGLRDQGVQPLAALPLPDHAVYTPETLTRITQAALVHDAAYLLTTEKDGVKLGQLPEQLAARTLLVRLDLRINDPAILKAALRNLLQKQS